jgi:vesicle coat complex subunit
MTDIEIKEAVPILIRSLKDPNGRVREAAVYILAYLNKESDQVIPALTQVFQDSQPYVRKAVVYAIGKIGRESDQIVAVLIQAFQNPHPDIRRAAVCVLGKVGRKSEQVVPVLIEALQDLDPHVRYMALRTLKNVGEKARNATSALLQYLKSSYDRREREAAAQALEKIDHTALRKEWLLLYSHIFPENFIGAFVNVFFGIVWGWLWVNSGVALFALVTGFRKMTWAALSLILVFTLFFMPWTDFPYAYDLMCWVPEFGNLAILWGVCFGLNCLLAFRARIVAACKRLFHCLARTKACQTPPQPSGR